MALLSYQESHIDGEENKGIVNPTQVQLIARATAPVDVNLANGRLYYNSANHKLCARVNSAWAVIGTIEGTALTDLSDVTIATVAANHFLQYDSGTSLWKNYAISGDITIAAGVAAIGAGVIVAADIAANAVETAKILAKNVTTAKIADAAITQAQQKTKAVVALADAAATLTAAEMVNSGIFTITPTVARILTTDTAANIVAALPEYQVGTWFDIVIVNTAAFDVTLAAGTGITLSGKAIINNVSGTWRARIDSATAITIYRM